MRIIDKILTGLSVVLVTLGLASIETPYGRADGI